MAIDRQHFFRTLIDNMLRSGTWVEDVFRLTGIIGVSQVWDDQPEWYIWISGKPGPYSLTLEQVEGAAVESFEGYFAVKCFPEIDSSVYAGFSPHEREMLNSPLFDNTRVPVFETRLQIPPAFFNVGTMLVRAGADEGAAVFTYESLDALRLFETAPSLMLSTASNEDERLIRCVTGWEIGYPLFDVMASLYAFYSNRSPCWLRMTRAPGFEHIQQSLEIVDIRKTSVNQVFSISLVFSDDDDDELRAKSILPEIETDETIVFDTPLNRNSFQSGILPNPYVNVLWWHLAESRFKSDITTLCGCKGH